MLIGCGNTTSSTESISTSTSTNTNEYISDDESDYIKFVPTKYYFETYDDLVDYIKNDFYLKNTGKIWSINPIKYNDALHMFFEFQFDDENNGLHVNPRIRESFCVYDESLGSVSDYSLDVPYYSFRANSIFYPTNSESKSFTYKIEYISDIKFKITL